VSLPGIEKYNNLMHRHRALQYRLLYNLHQEHEGLYHPKNPLLVTGVFK